MDTTKPFTPFPQGKVKVTACDITSCSYRERCIGKWFEIDKERKPAKLENDYKIFFKISPTNCSIWNSEDKKCSYELEEDVPQCICPKAAKQKK